MRDTFIKYAETVNKFKDIELDLPYVLRDLLYSTRTKGAFKKDFEHVAGQYTYELKQMVRECEYDEDAMLTTLALKLLGNKIEENLIYHRLYGEDDYHHYMFQDITSNGALILYHDRLEVPL